MHLSVPEPFPDWKLSVWSSTPTSKVDERSWDRERGWEWLSGQWPSTAYAESGTSCVGCVFPRVICLAMSVSPHTGSFSERILQKRFAR